MISPKVSQKTTWERVWEIPAPALGKDVSDTLFIIKSYLEEQGKTMYDDTVTVTGEAGEWLRFTILDDTDWSDVQ